jgi:hypothetical protein
MCLIADDIWFDKSPRLGGSFSDSVMGPSQLCLCRPIGLGVLRLTPGLPAQLVEVIKLLQHLFVRLTLLSQICFWIFVPQRDSCDTFSRQFISLK